MSINKKIKQAGLQKEVSELVKEAYESGRASGLRDAEILPMKRECENCIFKRFTKRMNTASADVIYRGEL